jgi:hypothetical protein
VVFPDPIIIGYVVNYPRLALENIYFFEWLRCKGSCAYDYVCLIRGSSSSFTWVALCSPVTLNYGRKEDELGPICVFCWDKFGGLSNELILLLWHWAF